MKIRVITAALVLVLAGCEDEQNQFLSSSPDKSKAAICNSAFLTMRADPYILAPKLAFLEKGEQVAVLNVSNHKDRIGKKNTYWYLVEKKNGIQGWTYGGYLSLLDVDNKEQLEASQSNIREKERKQVRKFLYGKYFSVDNEGVYTKEKVYFFGQLYGAGRVGQKLKEGSYTVNPVDKTIELSEGSSVGKSLTYVLTSQSLTLYGKRGGQTVRLAKGEHNPYADEVNYDNILPEALLKLKKEHDANNKDEP